MFRCQAMSNNVLDVAFKPCSARKDICPPWLKICLPTLTISYSNEWNLLLICPLVCPSLWHLKTGKKAQNALNLDACHYFQKDWLLFHRRGVPSSTTIQGRWICSGILLGKSHRYHLWDLPRGILEVFAAHNRCLNILLVTAVHQQMTPVPTSEERIRTPSQWTALPPTKGCFQSDKYHSGDFTIYNFHQSTFFDPLTGTTLLSQCESHDWESHEIGPPHVVFIRTEAANRRSVAAPRSGVASSTTLQGRWTCSKIPLGKSHRSCLLSQHLWDLPRGTLEEFTAHKRWQEIVQVTASASEDRTWTPPQWTVLPPTYQGPIQSGWREQNYSHSASQLIGTAMR